MDCHLREVPARAPAQEEEVAPWAGALDAQPAPVPSGAPAADAHPIMQDIEASACRGGHATAAAGSV